MSTSLFIALDDLCQKEAEALRIAEELVDSEAPFGFKMNLDYLLSRGLKTAVSTMQRLGRPLFADIKMWNGERTMESVTQELVDLGVDYLNAYILADAFLESMVRIADGTPTKVLGVTVLTHFDDRYCQRHFCRPLREAVRHFAQIAIEVGCHGIILPGTCLGVVADLATLKVVPGVRPDWYGDARHHEEIEPRVAVAEGANILVCGSPIVKSPNREEALRRILSDMR